MMTEVKRASRVYIPLKEGGILEGHDEAGEVVTTISLPGGVYSGRQLLAMLPRGLTAMVDGFVYEDRSKGPIFPEGFHETAMVQGYQPSAAAKMARMIDERINLAAARLSREVKEARIQQDVAASVEAVTEDDAAVDEPAGEVEEPSPEVSDL